MHTTARRLVLIGLGVAALVVSVGCEGKKAAESGKSGGRGEPSTAPNATPPVTSDPTAAEAIAQTMLADEPEPAKTLSNVAALVAEKPAGSSSAPAPKPAAEAPMTLTGSDGTGLKLVSLDARSVVEGPLALTELRLTFNNPEARRREGRFAITLPASASISRFAMKIRGSWMEGEVVEKQRARRIYEDFLHRRQDPAILEQDAGNTFRARVFPIEANESKELIVSYSQTLTSKSSAYTLPLRGLPVLDELKIRAYVHGSGTEEAVGSLGGSVGSVKVVRVDKQTFEPREDFEIYPSPMVTAGWTWKADRS